MTTYAQSAALEVNVKTPMFMNAGLGTSLNYIGSQPIDRVARTAHGCYPPKDSQPGPLGRSQLSAGRYFSRLAASTEGEAFVVGLPRIARTV